MYAIVVFFVYVFMIVCYLQVENSTSFVELLPKISMQLLQVVDMRKHNKLRARTLHTYIHV